MTRNARHPVPPYLKFRNYRLREVYGPDNAKEGPRKHTACIGDQEDPCDRRTMGSLYDWDKIERVNRACRRAAR